jgi:hypothetical protein
MTRAIEQSAAFACKPADLYELFMDSAKHSASTGAPAKISRRVGGKWSAHGGMIGGRNLALVPNRMIVQSWRSRAFKPSDPDSILICALKKPPEARDCIWPTSACRRRTTRALRKAGRNTTGSRGRNISRRESKPPESSRPVAAHPPPTK